ncbi:alanine racemase [Streptomyces sp. NBC_00233]|uniref:alanine racemase n=1 Tax=Streptomyces sp. NBC_00233 TaxID=2975686 RepID=UPI002255DF60|nr:alanine racemase [Streptomyces sp. NBC_00233]MCX5232886.1 alanine racemase [Streptomyces sp. NBC_00233]
MTTETAPHRRAYAEIDLDAVRHNVRVLRAGIAPHVQLMAVVKADGYGHGALRCARAALAAGASWLGTATPHEALALRSAGITDVPVLCWLWAPGDPWARGIEAGLDMSVSALWALDEVRAGARATGKTARIQLKADTGLGRSGCQPADWPRLVGEALDAQGDGLVEVTGLWSHLACADVPGHPLNATQVDVFRSMVEQAERAGVEPEVRHIANSAATLTLPEAHFDLVRTGVALYGLSPGPAIGTSARLGLRPAMSLKAIMALVKRLPGGHSVSYGRHHVTEDETTVGLIPLGYADGIPRHASGRGPVLVGDDIRQVAGQVAMDQFMVDLRGDAPEPGSPAVLFGPGSRGEPTAQDWAEAAGTIVYDIVTRIGTRVPRVYANGGDEHPAP